MTTGVRSTAPITAGLAVALLAAPDGAAQSFPHGPGTDCADFEAHEHTLTITQLSPDCVIDWAGFSIGEGVAVHFVQAAGWRILNRVTGGELSRIAGTLGADGVVYLVNPHGILFTGSAAVDAGALYAAAASMSDEDFRAHIDRFTSPSGPVTNEGLLRAGAVHLVGRRVANLGAIRAEGGVVTMLAGESEILIGEADGRVLVRIDGTDIGGDGAASGGGGATPDLTGAAGVTNAGAIDAAGGHVVLGAGDLYTLAVRNSGHVGVAGGSARLAALGGAVVHGGAGASLVAAEVAMSGDAIALSADVRADLARFDAPVLVEGAVTIEGADGAEASSVRFGATVDGAGPGAALAVRSAGTAFTGDVGAAERLDAVEVSGDATFGGDVLAHAGIALGGSATLDGAGDQTMDAGAGPFTITGSATKTGAGGLTLAGTDLLRIGGNVAVEGAGDLVITTPLLDLAGSLGTSAGDVEVLGGALVGGGVTAAGDITFGGTLQLGGDVRAGGDVAFESITILNSAATQSVAAGGALTSFFGVNKIGGGGLRLDAGALVDLGGGIILGTGGDVTITAPAIEVGGAITAPAGDVVLNGAALVLGTVGAGDDARFNGDVEITGGVTAGQDAVFAGAAAVGGDVTAGDDARFLGAADVGGSVTAGDEASFAVGAAVGGGVAADQDVQFHADATVGGDVTAGDDIDFGGAATVGGSVAAEGDVEITGATTIGGSVTAGDDIVLGGAAAIGGDVVADDGVDFLGAASVAGDIIAGGDVVFAGTADVGGTVVAGDDADFLGAATIAGSVLVTDGVLFATDAVVGGAVTGDDVEFLGAASLRGGVTALDDVLFAGAASVGGAVIAGDDIVFLDTAALGASIAAAGDVSFEADLTLSGAGDQRIAAGDDLVLRGDVRKTTGGALDLVAADQMTFRGALVEAIGDLRLNADGRAAIPEVATIVARNDVRLASLGGDVLVGPNEKLSVLGALEIDAAGAVTLGDVNAEGDLAVTAGQIFIRTRPGGLLLADDGSVLADDGVDLVAGGRFLLSVAPTILGGGAPPLFASAVAGGDALGTLSAFRLRVLAEPPRLAGDGFVFDLRADGPVISDLAVALAEDAAKAPATRSRRAEIGPETAAMLGAIGLAVRPVAPAERAARAEGPAVIDDLAPPGATLAGRPIDTGRLDPVAVERLLEAYRALTADRAEDVRSAIAEAWTAYAGAAGAEGADPAGFIAFVTDEPAHAGAAAHLARLREVLGRLAVVGATAPEIAAARRTVIGAFAPEAMGAERLEAALARGEGV